MSSNWKTRKENANCLLQDIQIQSADNKSRQKFRVKWLRKLVKFGIKFLSTFLFYLWHRYLVPISRRTHQTMWSWRNMFWPNLPLTELAKVWHVTTENAYQSGPIHPLRMEMTRNTSALSGHPGTEAPRTFSVPPLCTTFNCRASRCWITYFAKPAAELWHFKVWSFFLQHTQQRPLHSCPCNNSPCWRTMQKSMK